MCKVKIVFHVSIYRKLKHDRVRIRAKDGELYIVNLSLLSILYVVLQYFRISIKNSPQQMAAYLYIILEIQTGSDH